MPGIDEQHPMSFSAFELSYTNFVVYDNGKMYNVIDRAAGWDFDKTVDSGSMISSLMI